MKHNGKVSIDVDLDKQDHDEIFEWIRDRFSPNDVFLEEDLSDWAFENGFTRSADENA